MFHRDLFRNNTLHFRVYQRRIGNYLHTDLRCASSVESESRNRKRGPLRRPSNSSCQTAIGRFQWLSFIVSQQQSDETLCLTRRPRDCLAAVAQSVASHPPFVPGVPQPLVLVYRHLNEDSYALVVVLHLTVCRCVPSLAL